MTGGLPAPAGAPVRVAALRAPRAVDQVPVAPVERRRAVPAAEEVLDDDPQDTAGTPQEVPPVRTRWGGATHQGRVREQNEDTFRARPPMFLVADGMGGHAAGSVASALVVAAFRRFDQRTWVSEDDLRDGVLRARKAVADFFTASGSTGGATLAGLGVSTVGGQPAVVLVNVGDSRTYRLRDGVLEQLSKDHSVVQELVDSGVLHPDDMSTHPHRHVITRAVSPTGDSHPDVWSVPVHAGERFLVCSDGLTGELPDDEVRRVLLACPQPQQAADELVLAAVGAGGRDNVTAVVLDVVSVEGGEHPEHD